jgi:hypothetical protein
MFRLTAMFPFRLRYIHLVAKYYLHDRLRIQAGAFFRFVSFIFFVLSSSFHHYPFV